MTHRYYILLSPLFFLPLLYSSNPMLLYNFRTTCCTIAPSPGILVLDSLLSSSLYTHILYTPQTLPLPWVLSTPLYILLLPLGAALLLHYVSSLSPTPRVGVPFPLLFSFLSSMDTPTSCALLLHIQNTSLRSLLLLASSPLLHHTA